MHALLWSNVEAGCITFRHWKFGSWKSIITRQPNTRTNRLVNIYRVWSCLPHFKSWPLHFNGKGGVCTCDADPTFVGAFVMEVRSSKATLSAQISSFYSKLAPCRFIYSSLLVFRVSRHNLMADTAWNPNFAQWIYLRGVGVSSAASNSALYT